MPEEDYLTSQEANSPETDSPSPVPAKPGPKKKKGPGKWFNKIPKEVLLSPAGAVLIFAAILFEFSDLLIPGGSWNIEIVPDLIFAAMLVWLAKVPWQSTLIFFGVERIPGLSDVVPSWIIRLLV